MVLWRLIRPFRTNTPKICPFLRDWNAKVGSEEIPGITGKLGLGVQNEAGRRLTRVLLREHTGHSKHPFQQPKRRLYTWASPDDQYWNQIDYVFFAAEDGALYSQQQQDLELTASDHQLGIAKFRFILKKVGKTTSSFIYDLNQILYDYTVEMMNRFKRLDLIERVLNYGWRFVTLYRRRLSKPFQ